ncbi:MAG: hypothetical protein ACOY90_14665 [Candidatus Zhuqueibacterota bacterium]
MVNITAVVEDELHENILKKMQLEIPDINIEQILGKRGSGYVEKHLKAFNNAAKLKPYVILLDLDFRPCPPSYIKKIVMFNRQPQLCINIAVRIAETWLIADRKNFAGFLGISMAKICRDVESIAEPKKYIFKLTEKSRNRQLREAIIPRQGARTGPLYNTALAEFIFDHWDINQACECSPSLCRFIERFKMIGENIE